MNNPMVIVVTAFLWVQSGEVLRNKGEISLIDADLNEGTGEWTLYIKIESLGNQDEFDVVDNLTDVNGLASKIEEAIQELYD